MSTRRPGRASSDDASLRSPPARHLQAGRDDSQWAAQRREQRGRKGPYHLERDSTMFAARRGRSRARLTRLEHFCSWHDTQTVLRSQNTVAISSPACAAPARATKSCKCVDEMMFSNSTDHCEKMKMIVLPTFCARVSVPIQNTLRVTRGAGILHAARGIAAHTTLFESQA